MNLGGEEREEKTRSSRKREGERGENEPRKGVGGKHRGYKRGCTGRERVKL